MRVYFKFIKTGYIPTGTKSDHISNPLIISLGPPHQSKEENR
jgi:hypothetical protein